MTHFEVKFSEEFVEDSQDEKSFNLPEISFKLMLLNKIVK